MPHVKVWCAGLLALGTLAAPAAAPPFAYEPTGLAWSAEEVDRANAHQMAAVVEHAQRAGQFGCRRHCARLARVFERLVVEARAQTPRSAALAWSLTVVRQPEVGAFSLPDGRIAISEAFVDAGLDGDEALAFVLAHEMAHSILEHERQTLTLARLLLPPGVARSVNDIYVELDFNLALLRQMQPLMQQGEYEADELGLMLAAAAGYAPDRQLAFLEDECRAGDERPPLLLETHPPACSRLQALRARLPLARRQLPATATAAVSPPLPPPPGPSPSPVPVPVPVPVPSALVLADVR